MRIESVYARRLVLAASHSVLLLLLSGCAFENAPVIAAKGPVAVAERDVLFRAFAIMMIVVVPVFVMTFAFARRYRASNIRARYEPEWMSDRIDAVVWIVPALIVASVGIHVWIFTHSLDPYKPLDPSVKPLEVQAIAQDWKWLFVYPEQRVATVNELAFRSGVPLSLKITSDTVMNSFFVPALGGQIYAMAGMQTQLNLLADEPGMFVGRNTQYSGEGFADQHFAAIALSSADFESWVANVRRSPDILDDAAYATLARPSAAHPVSYYSDVRAGLFDRIILKYDCGSACTGETPNTEAENQ